MPVIPSNRVANLPLTLPSSRVILLVALALLAATLLGIAGLDRLIARLLQEQAAFLVGPSRAVTDAITAAAMPQLPKWVHPLAIALLALAIGLRRGAGHWRRVLLITAATLLATRLSVSALKSVFSRVRPYDYLADPMLGDFFIAGHDSFPSGHTAVYMGLLLPPALLLRRWRWPLLGIASLCALGRVIEGDHYLSDIMASTLIALIYVVLFSRLLGIASVGSQPSH